MHDLILGGAGSGKSRCAEARARNGLQKPGRRALLIATALPGEPEMLERIVRHRARRAPHVLEHDGVDVSRNLPAAFREWAAPETLPIADCPSVWLTQRLMPLGGAALDDSAWQQQQDALCLASREAPGPVVPVSNKAGMGVAPPGRAVRHHPDALGTLHQRVAAARRHVTLTVAGIELGIKQ